MTLKVTTSQFPVSSNIELNRNYIIEQTRAAAESACHVIHFPEGSLSGYAGVDFDTFENYDWNLLRASTKQVMEVAKTLGIWVILGSSHELSGRNKPRNSLYIINDKGELVDRYDKLFCAGDDTNETGDLKHYSSGNHFTTFRIRGVQCGVLVCHDYRYPELYRELKKQGVQVVFHSYHAGNMSKERQVLMENQIGKEFEAFNAGKTYPEITMPATMVSYASINYVWVSCSNTSARESCWPGFMVRPDGVIVGKLKRNEEGILITEVNTLDEFYDSTFHWRQRAMEGMYYSGDKVMDDRSENRTQL